MGLWPWSSEPPIIISSQGSCHQLGSLWAPEKTLQDLICAWLSSNSRGSIAPPCNSSGTKPAITQYVDVGEELTLCCTPGPRQAWSCVPNRASLSTPQPPDQQLGERDAWQWVSAGCDTEPLGKAAERQPRRKGSQAARERAKPAQRAWSQELSPGSGSASGTRQQHLGTGTGAGKGKQGQELCRAHSKPGAQAEVTRTGPGAGQERLVLSSLRAELTGNLLGLQGGDTGPPSRKRDQLHAILANQRRGKSAPAGTDSDSPSCAQSVPCAWTSHECLNSPEHLGGEGFPHPQEGQHLGDPPCLLVF